MNSNPATRLRRVPGLMPRLVPSAAAPIIEAARAVDGRAGSETSGSRSTSSRHGREPRSRSEEHTSELQSPYDLVCRLLLEKKKTLESDEPYRHEYECKDQRSL